MNICELIHNSNVAKNDIKKLIHNTYYTNRKENYGTICLHGESVSIENVGIGDKVEIPPEKTKFSGCSGGAKKLAEIHTHPSRNLFLSEGDILDSFRRKIDTVCIAIENEFKEDRVRCYTLKERNKGVRADNLKNDIEIVIPKIRNAIRNKNYQLENELRDEYKSKRDELYNLMNDALNWFDYCDLYL